MLVVPTEHLPGVVAICSGDLARYTDAMMSISGTHVPNRSCDYWKSGTNIANSINDAFRDTLAHEIYQWCWLMGDDHVYDPGILIRLLDRNLDVVVPLCLNRLPPFDPTIIKDGRCKRLEELPTRGLYELGEGETCGDAGMLIRRHVLEAIEPPWYDRLRHGSLGVDDQEFVARVRRAGFKVHVDIDNRIGHMTPFCMYPVNDGSEWRVRFTAGRRHALDADPKRLEEFARH